MTGLAHRVHARLARPGLLRGALTISAGIGLAQAISIGVSPVITRLYAPADFGAFAAVASLLGILITVSTLAYHVAIPLPESDDRASEIVVLSLIVAAIMSALTVITLALMGDAVLRALGAAVLGPYVLLLSAGQFGGATVEILAAWAVRTRSYGQVGAQRLAQSVTAAATQVGLGIAGFGALGLLLGAVLSSFAGSIRLARHAWRSHAQSFRAVTMAGVRNAASRYRRFPLLGAPSRVLNTVSREAPVLMIVALYGVSVGGQFALAQRVVMMPVGLIASSVAQAYLGEAAQLANAPPGPLESTFLRATRSLALAGLGPLVVAIVAAPILFGFIFGQEWVEAGLFLAILAPMTYLRFIENPTAPTLDFLERQDLVILRESVRLASTASVIAVAALLDFTPTEAIISLSAVGCAAYIQAWLLSWHAIRSHSRRYDTSSGAQSGA